MKQLLSAFLDRQPVQCHFPSNIHRTNKQPLRDGAFARRQSRAQLSPHARAGWPESPALHGTRVPVPPCDIPGCQGSTVLARRFGFYDPSHDYSLLWTRFRSL